LLLHCPTSCIPAVEGLVAAKLVSKLTVGTRQWKKTLPELLALQSPSQEKLFRLVNLRQGLIADQEAELLRLQNKKAEIARIDLNIAQVK
jgi:hypothetical protein